MKQPCLQVLWLHENGSESSLPQPFLRKLSEWNSVERIYSLPIGRPISSTSWWPASYFSYSCLSIVDLMSATWRQFLLVHLPLLERMAPIQGHCTKIQAPALGRWRADASGRGTGAIEARKMSSKGYHFIGSTGTLFYLSLFLALICHEQAHTNTSSQTEIRL